MKTLFGVAALAAAGLMNGCAGPGYDASHSWDDGWRKGRIVELGDGVALAEKVSEKCRMAAGPASSGSRFATIQYRRDRRNIRQTMPVSGDFFLKVGDAVFVNARDCEASIDLRRETG